MSIDILTASKTVVWNETRIPFKPNDYFSPVNMQQSLLEAMEGSLIDPNDDNNSFNEGYKSLRNKKSSKYKQINQCCYTTMSFTCYSAARSGTDLTKVSKTF
jgi:hypothetical protein